MASGRAVLGWGRAGARTDVAPRPAPRGRPSRQPPGTSWQAWVGLAVVGGLLAVALIGPVVVATDPARQDLIGRLAPPLGLGGTRAHPLGTDALGRDLLARLVAGARVSLLIGAV